MSEQVTEETTDEVEEEETPPGPEDDGEQSQEATPPAADPKLKRALERERAARKKLAAENAELRKAKSSGDMGEAEALKQQVEQLRQEVTTNKVLAALLRAGYNGDNPERMIKLIDPDDLDSSIEELKEDFSEKFGKKGARPGSDYKPGGPAGSKVPAKNVTEEHSMRLLRSGRIAPN